MVLAAHRILFLLAGRPVSCSCPTYGWLSETSYSHRSRTAVIPSSFTEIDRKAVQSAGQVCGMSGADPPRAHLALMSLENL